MKRSLLVLVLATAVSNVSAQNDPRVSALDRYRGETNASLMLCQLSLRGAELNAQLAELNSPQPADSSTNFRACIQKQRAAATALLQPALRTVQKPKARDALKAYHVIFVSTLAGISPGLDERKLAYGDRQTKAEVRLEEAWAAFEVEQ